MAPEIVFGKKDPAIQYKKRIGAYIVIPDVSEENILVVSPPNKTFLLPGGGIEAGEDDIATISRELIEEVGGTITINCYLGAASEYFYSTFRHSGYYHPAHFYSGKNFVKIQEPLEGDFNRISWMPVKEAQQKLKRPTHRWAIRQWLQRPRNTFKDTF
ncbi:NUDIX hydrolase [Loigolactobacillus backii]|uniref:NUDIX hydrolase n=1 Tax=Loigolactobacillus backii TaxID=375175 RepID=UPI0007F124DF|nr:NUDIX domain-containing protein [Loigolactobacillus backii]ANK60251.1 NUDIX hydrolase [Loigolactobacillus backii]ANK65133.1 NUDIX hydrolase [Loigolactobacillus backii]ANK67692.1 NUDIX hydrolase [Loigolactobacillus backii]OLF70172.1 NUDIX hydrolase [Loigolactobacillus backii]PIO87082.1 NUDIX hydrolase [Loigolactobacillus backii]